MSQRSRWLEHVLLFARRVRGVLTSLRALLRLVVGMRGRRPLELWIGDSHAVCLNMPLHVAHWSVGREGQVVVHMGGRLLYTTATKGLGERARRIAWFVGRFGRPGTVVPFLCAGEIDIRCHLVPRSAEPGFSLDFVGDYVRRAAELAQQMRSDRAVVVVPTPQSENIPQVARYPIRGTIEDRVAMTQAVRSRLVAEAAAWRGDVEVLVLDATEDLAGPDGTMRAETTSDGVHTNQLGVSLVRRRVRALGLDGQEAVRRKR